MPPGPGAFLWVWTLWWFSWGNRQWNPCCSLTAHSEKNLLDKCRKIISVGGWGEKWWPLESIMNIMYTAFHKWRSLYLIKMSSHPSYTSRSYSVHAGTSLLTLQCGTAASLDQSTSRWVLRAKAEGGDWCVMEWRVMSYIVWTKVS